MMIVLVTVECSRNAPTESDWDTLFSVLPVASNRVFQITPLGRVEPPEKTLPSNHVLFYLTAGAPVEVRAVGNATIRLIDYNPVTDDFRLEFTYSPNVVYYYEHVRNLPAWVVQNGPIGAGDLVGYADPREEPLGFGILDFRVARSFIKPLRYHQFFLNCGDPSEYFIEALKNEYLAKNPRNADPVGGKIDFDVDGTLAGNWFLEGTPVNTTASTELHGEKQLAFVYDMYDPSTLVFSAGGTLRGAPFHYHQTGATPDPATVTPDSGMVTWTLAWGRWRVLAAAMLDTRRARVELFIGVHPDSIDAFTEDASIYER